MKMIDQNISPYDPTPKCEFWRLSQPDEFFSASNYSFEALNPRMSVRLGGEVVRDQGDFVAMVGLKSCIQSLLFTNRYEACGSLSCSRNRIKMGFIKIRKLL